MAAKERFVYRGEQRTAESVVRKSKLSGGLYDSYLQGEIPMFKAKEGECCVRILPPTWEDLDKWGDGWEIQVYLHYSVGPDNAAYLCLDKMKGEDCPVCAARHQTQDEEESNKLKPSLRVLAWVIDRDNEKAGPMVWSMPLSLFREISARSIDKKTSTPILIDHPEEGYDLVFNREGTALKTKYTAVEIVRDPSPIHDDEKLQNRWLDYIEANSLPELLNYHEKEHIEKVLYGKAERGRGEDTPAETETPRGSRRATRASMDDEIPSEGRRPVRRTQVEESEPEPEQEQPIRRRGTVAQEPEPEPEAETPRTSRRRQLLDADTHDPETGELSPEESPRSRRGGGVEDSSPVTAARSRLSGLRRSTGR